MPIVKNFVPLRAGALIAHILVLKGTQRNIPIFFSEVAGQIFPSALITGPQTMPECRFNKYNATSSVETRGPVSN